MGPSMEMPAAESRARRALVLAVAVASGACNHANATPPPTPPPIVLPAPVAPVTPPAAMPDEGGAAVPIAPGNPTWGSRLALVTIVEYADFQCPFSMRVEPALAAVRETYGPDKVRIVWKNNPLPFHPNALPAAEAAMGVLAMAGSDAFWRFHDAAFPSQESLTPGAAMSDGRERRGSSTSRLPAGLESHRWAYAVDDDLSDGKLLGVDGTPMFFINGVAVTGAQPLDDLQEDHRRASWPRPRRKVESGTARDRVYAKLARDNRSPRRRRRQDEGDARRSRTVFKIPLGSSPMRGSAAAALVTIVEFSDFQCPFCRRVEPTLDGGRARSTATRCASCGRTSRSLSRHAEPAAEAALEVRAEKR